MSMYGNPGNSLIAGCLLKWPWLIPVAIIGMGGLVYQTCFDDAPIVTPPVVAPKPTLAPPVTPPVKVAPAAVVPAPQPIVEPPKKVIEALPPKKKPRD